MSKSTLRVYQPVFSRYFTLGRKTLCACSRTFSGNASRTFFPALVQKREGYRTAVCTAERGASARPFWSYAACFSAWRELAICAALSKSRTAKFLGTVSCAVLPQRQPPSFSPARELRRNTSLFYLCVFSRSVQNRGYAPMRANFNRACLGINRTPT